MTVIHAIFDFAHGVFTPTEPVSLPDKMPVEVHVPSELTQGDAGQAETLDILSRRYYTGQTDAAARHNEHQP
jgi:hypothetical protein